MVKFFFFFFQAEDGIRDYKVTGVQTVLFRSPGFQRVGPYIWHCFHLLFRERRVARSTRGIGYIMPGADSAKPGWWRRVDSVRLKKIARESRTRRNPHLVRALCASGRICFSHSSIA